MVSKAGSTDEGTGKWLSSPLSSGVLLPLIAVGSLCRRPPVFSEPCGSFLSSFATSLLLPGGGHHGDAGEEDASLPVASLWHLRVQVRAGGLLVPAVSDHEKV